jgi:hypothetical protein
MADIERQRVFANMFGTDAGQGIAAALAKTGSIVGMRKEIEHSEGATEKLGAVIDSTGKNAEERWAASMLNLKAVLGTTLIPALTTVLGGMADVVGGITKWANDNPRLTKALMYGVVALGAFAAGIAAVVKIIAFAKAAQGVFFLVRGYAALAGTLVNLSGAVSTVGPMITGLGSKMAALGAAAGPVLAVAAAIASLGLAISELVRHWDELNFGEAFKGIADSINESGLWETFKDLTDVTGLATDIGVMDSGAQDAAWSKSQKDAVKPIAAASSKQRIEGEVNVKIDSEGRAKVDKISSKGGVDLNVDAGLGMVTQ